MGAAKSIPVDPDVEKRDGSSKRRQDVNKKASTKSAASAHKQKPHFLPGIELEDNFDMVLQIQAAEAKRKQLKKEKKQRTGE